MFCKLNFDLDYSLSDVKESFLLDLDEDFVYD